MEHALRSFLFVPGDQQNKIEKAWRAEPDCVILDLEDGVSQAQKGVARGVVASYLTGLPSGTNPILVRVNPGKADAELDFVAAVQPATAGIVLPKCQSGGQVAEAAFAISAAEKRKGIPAGKLKLYLLIETARGLLDLASIASASDRVTAVIFGAEDWCLDMGITRTPSGQEIEAARWHIVLCARAHGLEAIDTIYPDFRDVQGLRRDTEISRRLGFSGKLAIHPSQIEAIHSAFAPSELEVSQAQEVVAAFDDAEARGLGAISMNGRMIDKPIAERARQILRRARKAK